MYERKEYPRVCKLLSEHRVIAYQSDQYLILKTFNLKQPLINVFSARVAYGQLPDLLKNNFSSIELVLQNLQDTKANLMLIERSVLTVQMQIGSKMKQYSFKLTCQEVTYVEEIQYMLWTMQENLLEVNREKASRGDVDRLKRTVDRMSRDITDLTMKLKGQKQINKTYEQNYLKLQEKYQSLQATQKLLDYEMKKMKQKMRRKKVRKEQKQEQKINNEEQQVIVRKHPRKKMEIGSLQPVHRQEILIVDRPSSSSTISTTSLPEQQKEISQPYLKFELDPHFTSQSQAQAFVRVGQRFKYVKQTQQARQFCSTQYMPQPRSRVTIRLVQSMNLNIWIGLFTHRRIQQQSTKREQGAISYKLKGGKTLFENGVKVGVNMPRVMPGEDITFQVDFPKKLYRLLHNEVKICDRNIPVDLQGVDLYPFVTMVNQNDEIQFL